MIGNIILLILVILFTWLLYHFSFSTANTKPVFRKLVLFFGFLAIASLFNGILTYQGISGLKNAVTSKPVRGISEFSDMVGDSFVLIGKVGVENISEDKNGYIAYSDDAGYLRSPQNMMIDLKGGSVDIANTNYLPIGWPFDSDGNIYLRMGQRVIIVGRVEHSDEKTIHADIVYAGSYDDFRARANFKYCVATILLFANLLLAVLIFLFILPKCVKGMWRGVESVT